MDKENLLHFPNDFPYQFTSTHSQPPQFDEDAWNVIYTAAAQVARMKARMIGVPQHFHPSPWEMTTDEFELFRQQHFCRNRYVSVCPPNQPLQNRPNQRGFGSTAVKRECVGTGVFLPRSYCDNPPESPKRQACSPSNMPAGMIQSSTKSFVTITAPPHIQAHINGSFVSHYDLLMIRRKAMILAAQQQQQRSNMDGGVTESAVNNPAVLLPQEWTY